MILLAAQVYERLKQMAIYFPVADQDAGSYLTINSNAGVQFMFIFFLSGLSQMLVSNHRMILQSLVDSIDACSGHATSDEGRLQLVH